MGFHPDTLKEIARLWPLTPASAIIRHFVEDGLRRYKQSLEEKNAPSN